MLILSVLIFSSLVFAEDNKTLSGENSQIDKAYKCLKDKVADGCSTSLEDNIFTLLAIKECSDEVLDNSDNKECWPKGKCDVETTAQAVLALDNAGHSTSEAEEWLLSQNSTPSDVVWYLEIESPKETICKISYGSGTYSINIDEDKKISSPAGSCLSLSDGNYWLRIIPSCYSETFEVSCNEQFLTTLLFRKQTSSAIYVSEETHSSSAEGTTEEKVSSFCFTQGGVCNYEGSLWASLVLDEQGYDVSSFIPYLVTVAGENQKYLPDSFLYLLTGYTDFRTDLLAKQANKYWDLSGDKFYDTALALYPFQSENIPEKENSKNWLLEIQGNDGCWDNGRIKSTAFVLNSIWPRQYSSTTDSGTSEAFCETSGYYCMHSLDCDGNVLENYECSTISQVCCDIPKSLDTCENEGGEICASNEICSGTKTEAFGLEFGESCCLGGRCEEQTTSEATCEPNAGFCRASGCNTDEEESFSYTCDYGDSCCVASKNKSEIVWWIWLLLVLIILLVIAIIFRDRVRYYFNRIKSKFNSDGKSPPSSAFPSGPRPPIMPRRILPPSSRPLIRRPARRTSEVDEVLKRLKEMGK